MDRAQRSPKIRDTEEQVGWHVPPTTVVRPGISGHHWSRAGTRTESGHP